MQFETAGTPGWRRIDRVERGTNVQIAIQVAFFFRLVAGRAANEAQRKQGVVRLRRASTITVEIVAASTPPIDQTNRVSLWVVRRWWRRPVCLHVSTYGVCGWSGDEFQSRRRAQQCREPGRLKAAIRRNTEVERRATCSNETSAHLLMSFSAACCCDL